MEVGDSVALQTAFSGPPPDAVLLDLKLPDADGLDLLPLIKRQWPSAAVIVLTGHASFEAAVEAIKRGAFHFQQKPIDPKGLLNLIAKALERKSLHEETRALRATVTALTTRGGAPRCRCGHRSRTSWRSTRRAPMAVLRRARDRAVPSRGRR